MLLRVFSPPAIARGSPPLASQSRAAAGPPPKKIRACALALFGPQQRRGSKDVCTQRNCAARVVRGARRRRPWTGPEESSGPGSVCVDAAGSRHRARACGPLFILLSSTTLSTTRLNLKRRYADPLRSSVYTSASTFSFFRCRWSPRNRASSPPCDTYTSTFVSFTCWNLYTVPCMA